MIACINYVKVLSDDKAYGIKNI